MLSGIKKMSRAAFKNKGMTVINIAGLGVALAVSMFLIVYLQFEFSYDRCYKDGDRVHRILSVWNENDITTNYPINFWSLADEINRNVPEVETVSRIYKMGELYSANENKDKLALMCYLVDSSFTDIFDFPVLAGDVRNAFTGFNSCIVTRKTAERYFGKAESAIGNSLTNGRSIYRIEAVVENVPVNSHLNFDMLLRLPDFGYGGLEYFTYIKLRPGVDVGVALDKCNAINKKLLDTRFGNNVSSFGSVTEPLYSLHTSTVASFDLSPKVDENNLLFIILVVLFIIGIAVCNFVSLYIIQGEKRSLEVCVRKTMGAERGSVMGMLFTETFFVTFLSFLLAIILYFSFADFLAGRIGFHIPEGHGITLEMAGYFVLLFLLMVFVAGGYPAYYLSRFNPIELIRKSVVRRYRLTAASVIIQFTVVIFCISSLLVVSRQLNYVKNLPLGYEPDNVMVVSAGGIVSPEQFESYRAELMKFPEIEFVALSQGHPGDGHSGQSIRQEGQSEKDEISIDERRTAQGYLKAYRIPIISGRDFSDNMAVEGRNLILSQTAAKRLGIEDAHGQKLIFLGAETWTLIGIAGDIHSSSARDKIEPLVYSAYAAAERCGTLSVRYQPGTFEKAKADMLSVLSKRLEGVPLSVVQMRDYVMDQYKQEDITARILVSGTVLAIVLALLGLVALTGFVAQQKRKEISVRRVLGAQVREVVYDLNRYVIIRILPAVPVGIALGYYVMNRWLHSFEYSIVLTWWFFGLALLLTFGIVLITIFYQSLHSAMANPVDALKSGE